MSAALRYDGERGYYPTFLAQVAARLRAQADECDAEGTDSGRMAAVALRDAAAELDATARAIMQIESDTRDA
jgi:hypothetical protein